MAPVSDLPSAGGVRVTFDGYRIAVFRIGDSVFAVDDACPHMGASLATGAVKETTVTCPEHRWCYDLVTGARLDRSGGPVRTHPARLERGMVQLRHPDHGA